MSRRRVPSVLGSSHFDDRDRQGVGITIVRVCERGRNADSSVGKIRISLLLSPGTTKPTRSRLMT